jgi:hypothetical protein
MGYVRIARTLGEEALKKDRAWLWWVSWATSSPPRAIKIIAVRSAHGRIF